MLNKKKKKAESESKLKSYQASIDAADDELDALLHDYENFDNAQLNDVEKSYEDKQQESNKSEITNTDHIRNTNVINNSYNLINEKDNGGMSNITTKSSINSSNDDSDTGDINNNNNADGINDADGTIVEEDNSDESGFVFPWKMMIIGIPVAIALGVGAFNLMISARDSMEEERQALREQSDSSNSVTTTVEDSSNSVTTTVEDSSNSITTTIEYHNITLNPDYKSSGVADDTKSADNSDIDISDNDIINDDVEEEEIIEGNQYVDYNQISENGRKQLKLQDPPFEIDDTSESIIKDSISLLKLALECDAFIANNELNSDASKLEDFVKMKEEFDTTLTTFSSIEHQGKDYSEYVQVISDMCSVYKYYFDIMLEYSLNSPEGDYTSKINEEIKNIQEQLGDTSWVFEKYSDIFYFYNLYT